MITGLHSTDAREPKVSHYITTFSHAVQDEFYLLRIPTMHEAMVNEQKVELKLKKLTPTSMAWAKSNIPSTANSVATTTLFGPLDIGIGIASNLSFTCKLSEAKDGACHCKE